MKFYKVTEWNNIIKEVEVSKQTKSSIYEIVNGKERRRLKESGDSKYFETYDLAYGYIVTRFEKRISYLQRQLKEEQEKFESFIKKNEKH